MKKESRVMEIIKQKYHPEQYAAEQAQKKEETAKLLAFVDGVLANHNLMKKEKEESNIFKSNEPSTPWDEDKVQNEMELEIAKLKSQGYSKDEILLKLLSELQQ